MSDFNKRIEDGLQGKYSGLKNGFIKVNKYIYGIQRGFYTLYGGLSGSAKTTLIDFKLLNALADAESQGIELDMFYYSYEIDETTKRCNWLSNRIYSVHEKVIPPQNIAGLGDNRLNEEQKKLVDLEKPYIDKLFKKINFRFDANNPIGIRLELFEFAKTKGEFIYKEYKKPDGTLGKTIVGYKPHNPDSYVLIALDHISLAQVLKGLTLKDNIDMLSATFIWFRNMCNFSFHIVQQFNQGLNSVDRMKFKGADITPQQNDFKDSTNPYTDSDVAIGIMNAWKMDMDSCLGYDLSILKEKFRLIKIIKNRKGRDNLTFGCYFDAESGSFFELPLPQEIEALDKIYAFARSINK
jgi:hypothetical protein